MLKKRWLLFPMLLVLVSLACAIPTVGIPQVGQTLTPNLTMTALFGSGILGSLTPGPTETGVAAATTLVPTTLPSNTNTPVLPTSTLIPPTETSEPTSTVTAPPTLTAAPATATMAGRPGPLVSAAFFSVPPVIDGLWSEWNTTEYPINSVVFGAKNWKNASDLSGSFRIGWSESFLYLAVKVKDEKYVQNSSGQDIYLGDSVEILLDTNLNGDFYTDNLNSDDYQFGISPGNPRVGDNLEAYMWYPSNVAGTRSRVTMAAVTFDGGYRVEAAIPWSLFGVDSARGALYGFCISISDNDNPDANVQQTLVSNCPDRHLTQPTTWGELKLK